MDKRNKFQQTNAKAATSDAKKNQAVDVVNNAKVFPKTSRKREQPGCSFSKHDQQNRPNAQKTKTPDKRFKVYNNKGVKSTQVADDESAELGSVIIRGSKKQNYNHLLNFNYAPSKAPVSWTNSRVLGFNNHYNRWLPPIQRHKYNKEQFLQANCQFVVTAQGNYSFYLSNPDALVDWPLIQQIRMYSPDDLSCPICLYPPVAGKMTRCGHVYCWVCILHYLALSDKTWRKCPICYEPVHRNDLKSVAAILQFNYNAGDEIVFRLMRREKGTLLAVPADQIEDNPPENFLTVADDLKTQVYSKLLLANPDDIINVIESERAQLRGKFLEDPTSPENCFIEQALDELMLWEQNSSEPVKVDQHLEAVADSPKSKNSKTTSTSPIDDNLHFSKKDKQAINVNDSFSSSAPRKFHYFYQAENGQNVFLHALNIKMLEMQCGKLEDCPRVVSGKLIEKEVGSLTEDLRRRMRYLFHLPVTCQFEIAEIEIQDPPVVKEVFAHFENEIKSRQKKREKKNREERKREKKIAEEENKRMGRYPMPQVHIGSHRDFPEFSPECFSYETQESFPVCDMPSSVASSPSLGSVEELAAGVEVSDEAPAWGSNHGPSFAQMLRTDARSQTTTSWPSKKINKSFVVKDADIKQEQIADSEMEEYMPPVYRQSLGDALAQALERTDLISQDSKSKKSNKNKKKSKTTVLFATNMARAS